MVSVTDKLWQKRTIISELCGEWKAISIKAKLIANASDFNQMRAEKNLDGEVKSVRNEAKMEINMVEDGNFLSFFAKKREKNLLWFPCFLLPFSLVASMSVMTTIIPTFYAIFNKWLVWWSERVGNTNCLCNRSN